MNRITLASGVVALSMLAAAFAAQLTGEIKIDGSSTVYPITTAVADEFRAVEPGVKPIVGLSGTGGGFKRFVVGETDISNASRPITDKEHHATVEGNVKYIELPVAYDGLSIVVNTKNTWVDQLTVDELKSIFTQTDKTAKKWSDVRAGWPAKEIKVFSPGTDSGTFDYFKEVMGKEAKIRGDMTVSEDDNVLVLGVSGEEGAIGFFGVAYYMQNKDKLKVVPVVNPQTSKAVEPTHSTIESGEYAPFSRPLLIYVNQKSSYKPEVKKFVDFYLDHPELVEEVGYVQLPSDLQELVKKKWRTRHTGTHYLTEAGEKRTGSLREVYR